MLHCGCFVSIFTINCECFHYGLHCWWELSLYVSTPSAHVAVGLCLWVEHSSAHTLCLGCAGLGTSGAWIMAKDSTEMSLASRPNSIGSFIMTQCSWVLEF